ncbi:MAG: hypothetical protein RR255_00530 [Bacilli bacterium]
MRKEFNWSSFINKDIAIHCKTEEEAKDFIKCADENGCHWINSDDDDENSSETTCYYVHGAETCYRSLYGSLFHGSTDYYKECGYIILEWSDYMEKEFTIEDLKSGYMVEIVKGSRCMVVTDHCGLSLYDTKTWNRKAAIKNIRLKNDLPSFSSYDIVKVYGYKKDALNQNTIDDRELLWEYEEPKKELTIEEIEKN